MTGEAPRIAELQARYFSEETTVTEVVEGCLQRIQERDRTGDCLNAMTAVNPRARSEAERLDAARQGGAEPGPLFGVPIVIKDNIDVEGLATTGGSAALAELIAARDATVVARLHRAGAVVIGKTNMSEFAFGTYDTQSSIVDGFTQNPHVPGMASGGSSGGTGAAIAAGYCVAGLGTDTGCSVRSPASINELVGLRPTHGSIDMTGIMPMNAEWDTVGPLATTVQDMATVYDVMRGVDPLESSDSTSAPLRSSAPAPMRVGVARAYVDPGDTDPEVLSLFNHCLNAMSSSGIEVIDPVDVSGFSVPFTARNWYQRFRADLDGYLADLGDRAPHPSLAAILATNQVHPRYRDNLNSLLQWPHEPDRHPLRAEMDRTQATYVQGFDDLMTSQQLDAIVFPTFRYPPVANGALAWTQTGDESPVGSNNYYASLTGFPALSVPMGRTSANLPVGIQMLGRAGTEGRLIRLAHSYEQHLAR